MNDPKAAAYAKDWRHREETAEAMVPLIGRLYREQGVVTTMYGRSLVHRSAIEILKAHRFTRHVLPDQLPVTDTLPVLEALSRVAPQPARIDLGQLTTQFGSQSADIETFLRQALTNVPAVPLPDEPRDVVLYGFGRIGRMLARILIERAGGLRWQLRAVVTRSRGSDDLMKRASLLRRDSVHGRFDGTIVTDTDENALVVNGNMIRVLYADGPDQVDYASHGINNAVVLDNAGIWRDREGLQRHLQVPEVSHVVLTAPGEGDVPNIVYGVNDTDITPDERILSAASCTTNAIVPVLKAMVDRFGVEDGHIETCHSYTNDQNLIDNYHRKSRRGRAAPLNMVITETAAASAVTKVLPELDGRLTANAIRVPTPNVSLAILNLRLSRPSTTEEVNAYLRDMSLDSPLQRQIDYTSSPEVVSSDFNGTTKTSIVDSFATIVQDRRCVLYVWYDNEYGYSCQVVRIMEHLVGRAEPTV